MLIRRIFIVAAILLLFGAIFYANRLGDQKAPPKQKEESTEVVRTVEVIAVENKPIPTKIDIQGRLAAYDKVDIFSEVSGVLESTGKPFKVGSYFKAGEVLLRINDEEARLNLLSSKSNLLNTISQMMPDLKIDYPESYVNWRNYLEQFDLENSIKKMPEPISREEKFFVASKNIYSQYYTIKSSETRLSKYTLYAPFSGVLTETSINPGSLVRNGQLLGELMRTNNYELEASVPVRDLKYIKSGNKVQLYSDDLKGEWGGYVRRISDQIDPNTQTVIVFVSVKGSNLREGMYLRGELQTGSIEKAVAVPSSLIVDQRAVYRVEADKLVLQPVEILQMNSEKAIIRGLQDGTPIVATALVGAYEGMKVKVEESGGDTIGLK